MEGAPLTDAALTAYRSLRKAEGGPGDSMAVVGVGGLGSFGVQFGRLWACRIVAVDRGPAELERAEELSADAAIGTDGSVPRDIEAAAGGPVDIVVVDFVGADETLRWASNALGADGHLVLAGIGGGSIEFAWNPLVGSEVTYRTVQWGTPAELRDVLDLARQGRLSVDVEPVDLADLPATLERLDVGEVEGRAVAVP